MHTLRSYNKLVYNTDAVIDGACMMRNVANICILVYDFYGYIILRAENQL